MKRLLAPAAALLALVAAPPLAAEALAPGEIALHVEALGDIPADTAVIPLQIFGRGKDEAAAKSDLAKKEKDAYAALAKLGIPRAKIEPVKETETQYAPALETAVPYGCAAAAAAERIMLASEPASVMAPPPIITSSTQPDCNPDVVRSRTLMVTVEELTKLPEVAKLVDKDSYTFSMGGYYARDPKAAHTAAVVEAIAKAREEAEAYAAAMGYRVLRMEHVGNAKAKINWPDLFMLGGGIAADVGEAGDEDAAIYQLRALAAGHFAGVTIDFVIAPK
jgi:uncharacterized protein YggE